MRRGSADKVAYLRALGSAEQDPALRNPDDMAAELLADIPSARLSLGAARRWPPAHRAVRWGFERMVPGVYWTEVARVKHFDRILLDEVAGGIRQVVILGAGLDTRAYRFAAELEGVNLYEVDHPVTAARKRERLTAVLGRPPSHVSYATADLNEESPGEALAAAGFDRAAPALVLWIGVAPYLAAGVVTGVLGWVADHPPTSSVGFDYFHRSFFGGRERPRGRRRVRRTIELSGERFVCGLEPGAIPALLRGCGLSPRSHLLPAEQEERYLVGSDGSSAGRPIGYAGFVHAEVPA